MSSNEITRYRASYMRRDNGSGIGIVETDGFDKTYAVHSLFYPTLLSHREASVIIYEFIKEDERRKGKALLDMYGTRMGRGWHNPYKSVFHLRSKSPKWGLFDEAINLAIDAIERRTSISEVLIRQGEDEE